MSTVQNSSHTSISEAPRVPIRLNLPPGTLNDNSNLSNRAIILKRQETNLSTWAFSSQVPTDSGHSDEGIPWHREFMITDNGTCPEIRSRGPPRNARRSPLPEARTDKNYRVYNTLEVRIEESRTAGTGQNDTIDLYPIDGGYEATWNINPDWTFVGATSISSRDVKQLGEGDLNFLNRQAMEISLQVQGRIFVSDKELEQWESRELEAFQNSEEGQGVLRSLFGDI